MQNEYRIVMITQVLAIIMPGGEIDLFFWGTRYRWWEF